MENKNLQNFTLPKTKDISVKFRGINCGDGGSFCWAVDKETFIKLVGREPRKADRNISRKGMYNVYMDDLYGFDEVACDIEISIKVLDK